MSSYCVLSPLYSLYPLNPHTKPHANFIIIAVFHWGLASSYSQWLDPRSAWSRAVLLLIERHTSSTLPRTAENSSQRSTVTRVFFYLREVKWIHVLKKKAKSQFLIDRHETACFPSYAEQGGNNAVFFHSKTYMVVFYPITRSISSCQDIF